jgi:hypothetical protein
MMYTLTIREEDYLALRAVVFGKARVEGAAYLVCGESRTDEEVRLLVRSVVPVGDVDYLVREPNRLSIPSHSYAAIAKQAREARASIVFAHSHPGGAGVHSPQDDEEEPCLMTFFSSRSPSGTHGSLVLGDTPEASGRIWTGSGWAPVDRIRILGSRFRILERLATDEPPREFFDRQVRAFGPDLQWLLGRLHVGVVGVGGTGSAVAEQLVRLGVGELSLFDPDTLDATNVSRVYGSRVADAGANKALVAERHLEALGLQTRLRTYPRSIMEAQVARELRRCDVVFGCTDKEAPRGVLVALSLRYLIPVFDLGVKIDAPDRTIRSIDGRITIFTAGEACLFCRGRISAETIGLESLPDPEREARAREGYAPDLPTPDPAVITFTTAVAASAVTHFLNRLTGAIRPDLMSEYLPLFHTANDKVIRTTRGCSEDCICGRREKWGSGDSEPFLGLVWQAG